jgi:hypothetical protein
VDQTAAQLGEHTKLILAVSRWPRTAATRAACTLGGLTRDSSQVSYGTKLWMASPANLTAGGSAFQAFLTGAG